MLLKDIFSKKTLLILFAALLAGAVAGAGYTLMGKNKTQGYNAAQLTQNLHYAKVEAGRMQCIVLVDKAALYNEASALNGKIIERMSKDVHVDYLETVSSQDKDERYAVVAQQLEFRRFFGRRHIIPQGTQVLVLRDDTGSGETKGRVFVDGKNYDLDFETEFLRFPYVGQWKKVEFNGKPGFMKYNELSDSKLM